MSLCTVTYGEAADSFPAETGDRLLDVILANAPHHPHVCGGNGFCTSCRVEVQGALSPPSHLERERLGNRCGRLRLACQARVAGDVTAISRVRSTLIDWE